MSANPSSDESLLRGLRTGDNRVAEQVFFRFFGHLVRTARTRLYSRTLTREDPEDAVQSAFRSFFQRVEAGQFQLASADDVLALLVKITTCKCINRNVKHGRARRSAAREVSASDVELLAHTAQPDEEAISAEVLEEATRECDEEERTILALYLEGQSNQQIAEQLEISERGVRRALQYIREHLERMSDEREES